jgi:hypothetical protein
MRLPTWGSRSVGKWLPSDAPMSTPALAWLPSDTEEYILDIALDLRLKSLLFLAFVAM